MAAPSRGRLFEDRRFWLAFSAVLLVALFAASLREGIFYAALNLLAVLAMSFAIARIK
jgi:hypothetical protein